MAGKLLTGNQAVIRQALREAGSKERKSGSLRGRKTGRQALLEAARGENREK
jgi:predicted transposase YdaD